MIAHGFEFYDLKTRLFYYIRAIMLLCFYICHKAYSIAVCLNFMYCVFGKFLFKNSVELESLDMKHPTTGHFTLLQNTKIHIFIFLPYIN